MEKIKNIFKDKRFWPLYGFIFLNLIVILTLILSFESNFPEEVSMALFTAINYPWFILMFYLDMLLDLSLPSGIYVVLSFIINIIFFIALGFFLFDKSGFRKEYFSKLIKNRRFWIGTLIAILAIITFFPFKVYQKQIVSDKMKNPCHMIYGLRKVKYAAETAASWESLGHSETTCFFGIKIGN